MSTFIPNPGPWLTGVLTSGPVAAAVAAAAQRVASSARAAAPVETGEYRDGITASTTIEGDRIVGTVTATAPHSRAVEWGGRNTPAHHVMGKAAGTS